MNFWNTWIWAVVLIAAAIAIGLLLHGLAYRVLARFVGRTDTTLDDSVVRRTRGPARLAVPLLAVLFVLPNAPLTESLRGTIGHLVGLGLIACIAWAIIAFVDVLEDVLSARYRIDTADNLAARRVATQMQVMRRVTVVIVTILADHGTRYASRLFNPRFLRSKGLPVPDWLERNPAVAPDLA